MKSPRFIPAVSVLDRVICLICLIRLWQIAEKAGLPFPVSKRGNGIFRVVSAAGAASSSVQKSDLIVSLRGEDVESLDALEFLLDGMRIGDELPVRLSRSTETVDLNVRPVHAYGVSYIIVAWLAGTLFFISGIVVYYRKRDDVSALVYHFGAIAVSVVIMSTWGCYAIGPAGAGQLIGIVFSAAYAFVPALFLHFSLVFPSRRKAFLSGYEYFPYLLAVLLSLLTGATFVMATMPPSMGWFYSSMAVFNVTRWFYASCVVLSVAIFIGSYRVAKEEMERRKLRWIMLGPAISSLGFVSLWQIPLRLISRGVVREEFVVLLSIYSIIVGTVAAFVVGSTATKLIVVAAAAAVAVALLFEPLCRQIQLFVDKNFFRVKYDLRRVEAGFSNGLKRCVTPEAVADRAVATAASAIPVERIGYFLLEHDSIRLRLLAHRGYHLLWSRSISFDMVNFRSDPSIPVALEDKIEPGVKYETADSEVFRNWA